MSAIPRHPRHRDIRHHYGGAGNPSEFRQGRALRSVDFIARKPDEEGLWTYHAMVLTHQSDGAQRSLGCVVIHLDEVRAHKIG